MNFFFTDNKESEQLLNKIEYLENEILVGSMLIKTVKMYLLI